VSQTTIPLEKARVIHVPRDREMAAKLVHVESLREKKKRDAASTQALIDKEMDDLQALAHVVLDSEQVELPFEEEATAALAKIAATCSPVEAVACPVCGDCSCIQPEAGVLLCAFCKEFGLEPAAAVCIGVSAEKTEGVEESPACDTHCGHEQTLMKCRPVTPEDQPKEPTMAPEVKVIDCPLHGVDSKHAIVDAEYPAEGPAPVTDPGTHKDGADDEPVPDMASHSDVDVAATAEIVGVSRTGGATEES